jgi:hypothetical protein
LGVGKAVKKNFASPLSSNPARITDANLKLVLESPAEICCCSELRTLVALLPCASANMLKSFVLIGPEQKAINSVIIMWINSASSKKTPIMRFVKRCWQNSPQTIALADGDANTGGFLRDMAQSMVAGCILGLYQEEEIFSEKRRRTGCVKCLRVLKQEQAIQIKHQRTHTCTLAAARIN